MTATERQLEGQVAIVTGAGRGIGKAIALAYARAGAAVCCAARTAAEIDQAVQEMSAEGGRGLAVSTDVTNMASVQSLVQTTVERFGGLDILVINAGVNVDRRRVEESRPDDWRATLEVNLIGAYYCAQAAIPHLKRRGAGKIITIGSGIGHRGQVSSSAYACSKAGLWMLTRVLAQELWQDNISVNELIPGPVLTSMDAQVVAPQQPTVFSIDSEWIKTPDDVAPLALFLATQPPVGPTAQSFSLMRRDT
jgi:3-oxoacyl-[acyl-carrier protein] reductase